MNKTKMAYYNLFVIDYILIWKKKDYNFPLNVKGIIMTQKYDRFNLEEEIQNVWQTKDDLNAITERLYDDPDGPMTEDEIGNVLIGLSVLHETRCKKLWRVFETMIKEKGFNEVEKLTPGLGI